MSPIQVGHLLVQTQKSLISPGTERMLVEFSKGNLLSKAKAQPDKVKQVLDKIRTDGLIPTLETIFKRLDEPLPLGYCNVGIVVGEDRKIRVSSGYLLLVIRCLKNAIVVELGAGSIQPLVSGRLAPPYLGN